MRSLFGLTFIVCLSFAGKSQQSCEVDMVKRDTINRIDTRNQKQGNWVMYGRHKPNVCHNYNQLLEEGQYINNRKTGVWTEYYCNGKMRSQLTYVDAVLEGPATFYNEKGEVLETGHFRSNKWVNEKH